MVEAEVTFNLFLSRSQLTDNSKRLISNVLLHSALKIESRAKQKCPVDTGFLRASIHSRLIAWNHAQVGSSMAKYAAAVEFGTKPHRPPFAPIKRWAEHKGIPEAAYPILLKIQREGTPAQPFLRPALYEEIDNVTKLLIKAQREAIKQSSRPTP
ncbi:MAG: HK97 gp10 family phage protein [Candidatus Aureabacteria bacterium]|nr:HK97 gp10 family phage protein [Candidatus Auribacterota bacterium]